MSKPLLCVTVTGATTAELRQQPRRRGGRGSHRAAARYGQRSRTSPARSRGGRGRRSSRAAPRGKAANSRGSEEERKRILTRRLVAGRRVRRPRVARALRRPHRRGPAAGASCCRRTTITACRSTSTRACAAMRATGAEIVKIAARLSQPQRLPAAAHARRQSRRARQPRDHRDGAVRRVDARARRTLRIDLDVCGRAGGHRPVERAVDAPGLPLPLDYRLHRGLRRCRRLGRAFGVARHAQRGVQRPRTWMRSTCRCRRPAPRISRRSAARFASTAPASRFRSRCRSSITWTRSIQSRAASAPSTRFASTTAAGSAGTPMRADSSNRSRSGCRWTVSAHRCSAPAARRAP